MSNSSTKETNKLENFDAIYAQELELQRKLEKVEVAYVKTVEKYGEYSDLKSFVEYLRTMEKIFMESELRNRSFEQNKDKLIKLRIKLLVKNSSMNEDVLEEIYDYFKKAGQTVDNLYAIAKELLGKYNDKPECQEFIAFVQDIFVNFLNAEKEHISMDELRDRLIRARMEVISSSGNPNLMTLEKIYKEFRELLSK